MSGINYASPFLEVSSSAETTSRIANRIFSFARLADGWRYGEGRGATAAAVSGALSILSILQSHGVEEKDIEVFPDIEGGILVSSYPERGSLEVFCRPDGPIDLSREIGDEVEYELSDASWDDLKARVRKLWRASTKLSDFSIQGISAKDRGASRAWLSKTLQIAAGSPSSIHNAPGSEAEANARIYFAITSPAFREIRPFFGG